MSEWTQKDDSKLKRWRTFRTPWTYADIGMRLGRTADACKKRVQRLKAAGMWLLMLALVLMGTATTRAADEPVVLDPATWSGAALVGNDMAVLRLGFTPDQVERVTIGPEVGYIERMADGPDQGVTAGFFATYDLVQDATLDLLMAEVPVTWYIGVHGDVLFREEVAPDITAGLMTGLRIGRTQLAPGKTWCTALGIELQYLLTEELWQEFAATDGDDTVRLMVSGFIGHR